MTSEFKLPGQPAVADPVWARGWSICNPEVLSHLSDSVVLWQS